MDIEIVWRKPVRLIEAPRESGQDFILKGTDEKRVPGAAGVYIFARAFGKKYEPIYIGQADNLSARIQQHLKTNVTLMRALREAKKGSKVVLLAEVQTKQGQQIQRVLDIIEPTLIADAVATGYTLVNRQLTKSKYHFIVSNGATSDRGPFDRTYRVPIS
jgi:predicted GIY-YIG superfamily endonuclease